MFLGWESFVSIAPTGSDLGGNSIVLFMNRDTARGAQGNKDIGIEFISGHFLFFSGRDGKRVWQANQRFIAMGGTLSFMFVCQGGLVLLLLLAAIFPACEHDRLSDCHIHPQWTYIALSIAWRRKLNFGTNRSSHFSLNTSHTA